jgi:TRAP-type uncharacterized transport system substrate-binding protein
VFGIFGLRLTRFAALVLAGLLFFVGCGLIVAYFAAPHISLRITIQPDGALERGLVTALVSGAQADHRRVGLKTVDVKDLASSSKALEDGKVDIALIRSDVAPPRNGSTLVILRRDALAIVLPPGSPIDSVSKLAGKTIVIPAGPLQDDNSRALDLILNYFNIPSAQVKREFLPIADIGAALHHGRAAAAFAVGPVGPGQVVDTVAAIAKATRGTPKVLEFDDNDAISAQFPMFESLDIPQGAFRARPATPDDDIKGLAVSYRFVVPDTMLDIEAGAIGRTVLNSKARLMQITPMANQIQAPDTTLTNTILPIHPGFSNYLNNGDQSFSDEIQTYLYMVGIPLSLLGSAAAVLTGMISSRRTEFRQKKLFRLLLIADESQTADREALAALEREFMSIASTCVSELLEGSLGADQGSVSLAIDYARRALERREIALNASGVADPSATEQAEETRAAQPTA